MDSVLYLVCVIIASISTASIAQGDTCRACNCQFDNIQALDQLIKEEIATGKLHVATNSRNSYDLHLQCTCTMYVSALAFQALNYIAHWKIMYTIGLA